MKISAPILAITLGVLCMLTGCSHDYPLVANGYAETAEISAMDNEGHGNFALPVPPKSCLTAFRAMPDLATMAVRIHIDDKLDITYSSKAIAKALSGRDFSEGIFVADESGLTFIRGYTCAAEIK